jgi:hypothetical protein
MRRILRVGLAVCTAAAVGCGDESPTAVGADLMGPGVRTFEVTFDAEEFLVRDTTFDGIGSLNDADFDMAAHQFDGVLDARTLFSLLRPLTVTYTRDGATRIDSVEAVVGGTLTLIVDTIASSPGPIDLEIVQVTEAWHRRTATWNTRVDTAGVAEAWQTPGGSPGAVVARASWTSGDTLQIVLDSATVAVWDDTTAAELGGLIRTTTPGARVFFHAMGFRYDVRPVDSDTVVLGGSITDSKIIVTPEPDLTVPAGVLRIGGLPAWRALLHFRPLTDLVIPCGPGQPPGCTLRLEDVTVNLASVLLQPLPAGPRRTERPVRLEARAVLEAPNIPLVRSPLTPPLGAPTDSLAPSLFAPPGADPPLVRIPVTLFVQFHLDPPVEGQPPLWLALTAVGERGQFGYTAFGSMASDRPPQLRLTVSVPDEVLAR